MAGRGRGRGATLPAWMTAKNGAAAPAPAPAAAAASRFAPPAAAAVSRFAPAPAPAYGAPPPQQQQHHAAPPQQQRNSSAGQAFADPFAARAPTGLSFAAIGGGGRPGLEDAGRQQHQAQQQQQHPAQQQHHQQQQHPAHHQHMAMSQLQAPAPYAYHAAPPLAAVKPEDDPRSWATYKAPADGREYYHNRVTNATTYDKPVCLGGAPALPPCKWKEYDAPDGKKYFSDGATTTWEEPDELKAHKAAKARLAARTAEAAAAAAAPPRAAMVLPAPVAGPGGAAMGGGAPPAAYAAHPAAAAAHHPAYAAAAAAAAPPAAAAAAAPAKKKRAKPPPAEAVVYATKEEALAAFRLMLTEAELASTARWNDAQRACEDDPRWTALKTTGQKRQTFAEWQTKRAKEEKEAVRAAARKARAAFQRLLATTPSIVATTRWAEAELVLGEAPELYAIEDARERVDLFEDFVAELGKKEREAQRVQRQAACKAFAAFVGTHAAELKLDHKSRWADARLNLEQRKTKESSWDNLDETTRRREFQDFVAVLQRAEQERVSAAKDAKRKADKAARDAFRALLKADSVKGAITMETKWVAYKLTIEEDEAYTGVVGQGVSMLRDMFDDAVDDLAAVLKRDRRLVKAVAQDAGRAVAHDDDPEALAAALLAHAGKKADGDDDAAAAAAAAADPRAAEARRDLLELHAERPNNLALVCGDLVEKAAAEYAAEAGKREKAERRYMELLEDYYYRSDHVGVVWVEAQRDLKRHSAYKDLDEDDRKRMFDDHMASLDAKMAEKARSLAALKAEDEEGELSEGELADAAEGEGKGKKKAAGEAVPEKAEEAADGAKPKRGREDGDGDGDGAGDADAAEQEGAAEPAAKRAKKP